MITDAKISSAAKISPAKIAPAQVGQLMVAQADGKYAPVTISGDANLAKDGKLRLKNLDEITERAVAKAGEYFNRNEDALKRSDLKKGKTLVGGATTPLEVPVGTGASAIPQRDSSGNLKAETADLATNATTAATATNADKLDSQEGTHYLDVTNHTAGASTSLGVPENSVGVSSATKQGFPKIVYEANTGGGSNSYFTIPHALGYIPQVTIMHGVLDGSNTVYKEIDAEVESSNSQTIVRCSEQGLNLKVYLT